MSGRRPCPDCRASPGFDNPSYCPNCGQKLEVGPLRVGEVASEFFGALVSFEFPILRTTRDLACNPGRVASAWLAGQRRSYLSPIKFLVIVGVVVAIAYEPLHDLRRGLRGANEPVYETGLAHYAPQFAAFFCIGLLLPVSAALRAFGRLAGLPRTWLEWYALGLFCYGLGIVIQMAMQVVSLPFAHGSAYRLVELLVPLVVLAWGAAGFVEPGKRWRAVAVALFGQAVTIVALALAWELLG